MDDMSTQQHERIPQLTLGWRMKMALGEGSAQEMADYLGVSRQTLSRWMGDKGAPPKRAYLMQWAMRTGVPLKWLETGESPDDGGGGGGSKADLDQLTASKRQRTRPRSNTGGYQHAA